MRIALDTNILAYAERVNGDQNHEAALRLLAALPREQTILPVQVMGELFAVMVRKGHRSRAEARDVLFRLSVAYPVAETKPENMQAATVLAVAHHLSIWDAVILSVAAATGCDLLLSEDMHDGFTWRGVTVINPFAVTRQPLLESILGPNGYHASDTSLDE